MNDGDSNISQFTSVLTLINISDDVEGKYQCIISNHLGSVHSRKSQITVYGEHYRNHLFIGVIWNIQWKPQVYPPLILW